MAAMKPLGTIKDTALGTIRHPLGMTQKAIGAAVGTARGAAHGVASGVASGVSGLLPGGRPTAQDVGHPPAEKKAAERKVHGDPVAPTRPPRKSAAAKKAPTNKPAPKKTTSGRSAPARKATARKATAKKATAGRSASAPLTAAEVAAGEGPDVTTPAGTTGADVGTNPDTTDTSLEQPGTEPLVDPATVKAVASESETLRKGADLDKG